MVKTTDDAKKIRNKILSLFHLASLPGTSESQIKKLLSFVVVGGGPTGVEFAGELRDFLNEDLQSLYPTLYPHSTITLVQSAERLLNTYSSSISSMVLKHFNSQHISTFTNCRVQEVKPDQLILLDKQTNSKETIDYGLCVWSTGIAPNPLTRHVITTFPNQANKFAITVDPQLRVIGTNNIYALGDCATVKQPKLFDQITQLFNQADQDGNNAVDYKELLSVIEANVSKFPQLAAYHSNLSKYFAQFDENHDGSSFCNFISQLMNE